MAELHLYSPGCQQQLDEEVPQAQDKGLRAWFDVSPGLPMQGALRQQSLLLLSGQEEGLDYY